MQPATTPSRAAADHAAANGIEIKGVQKRFGNFQALSAINLAIPHGEITALLGPSGSGKTTLLRVIGGLEQSDEGRVYFFGEDYSSRDVRERGVGFVFQHYALFRHMNIFENVAFGLKIRPRAQRPSKSALKDRVMELLSMVQLDGLEKRLPDELSGGQKQRVALARALAVDPKVLLLDEPFGALDAKVRQELRRRLRELNDRLKITTLFVTHDQEEALEVCDRVVILNKGRIEQEGTPADVYDQPANPFVYGFLGNVNRWEAEMEGGVLRLGDAASGTNGVSGTALVPDTAARGGARHAVQTDAPSDAMPGTSVPGTNGASGTNIASGTGESVSLFVRPHDVAVRLAPEGGKGIPARIIRHRSLGNRVRLELLTHEGGRDIEAEISRREWEALETSLDAADFDGGAGGVHGGTVYLFFEGAKIYSKNENWSDYAI